MTNKKQFKPVNKKDRENLEQMRKDTIVNIAVLHLYGIEVV